MKYSKCYELVKIFYRSIVKIFGNFKRRIRRQERYPKSLEDIEKEIYQLSNIDDILNYILKYYNIYYSINKLNTVMNLAIIQRKRESNSQFSLKLMVQLYVYILLKYNGESKKDVVTSDEIEIFFLFINVLQNNISNNQVEQSIQDRRSDSLQSYLSYHFDFRKELWEYYEICRMFDNEARKQYGFSIYENFDKLLYIICNVKSRLDGLVCSCSQFSDRELDEIFGDIDYSKLFMTASKNMEVRYLTSSIQILGGSIGIQRNLTYFLPASEHILSSIEQKLISSSNNKGDILEKELKTILENYFDVDNVYQSLYLKTSKKEEQDFIVISGNNILLIECKARDFKEIPFNQKMSEERRQQLFKKVVLAASEQAERAKQYILNNEIAIFTDKKGSTERLRIENIKSKKIYKVVVTLDDYYKLSEMAIDYFKDRNRNDLIDTWIVNYFDFQKIIWHSGIEKIFDYISYRTSGIETIRSIQASEIAQYGYYISPNYNFIPPNGYNIEVNIMGRFENWSLPFEESKNELVLNNTIFKYQKEK